MEENNRLLQYLKGKMKNRNYKSINERNKKYSKMIIIIFIISLLLNNKNNNIFQKVE